MITTFPLNSSLSNQSHWVDSTLKQLSLEAKIGQLIMPAIWGKHVYQGETQFQDLQYQLKKIGVGGFILFEGGVYESAALIDRLQVQAQIPLLIGSDFERGAAFRIRNTIPLPWNMAVGATASDQWAYIHGQITAREARAIGVNWVFAPVIDVNNNPSNPVINIRSYGEDPVQVGRLGSAFVKGIQEVGLLATAKHFPGHGDTEVDSHLTLPVLRVPRSRLDKVELVPFRQVIQAGVLSVMTGHLSVPALERESDRPATLSAAVLEQTLRNQLGFRGLIVSDSMRMRGLTKGYWSGEAAVQAVKAGVDVLLDPPSPKVIFHALLEAVRKGELLEARVNRSVERILQAKAWLNLSRNNRINFQLLAQEINSPSSCKQAQQLVEAAVTLVRDRLAQFPLDVRCVRSVHLVVISDRPSLKVGAEVERQLLKRVDVLTVDRLSPSAPKSELTHARVNAKKAAVNVVVFFAPLVTGTGRLALLSPLSEWVERLIQLKPDLILISLGNPYLIQQFPSVSSYLCTYSHEFTSQAVAVKALFGEIPIGGKLPVSIPRIAKRFSGLKRKSLSMILGKTKPGSSNVVQPSLGVLQERLNQLIQRFILRRSFPGASLAVGYRGDLLIHQGYGRLTYGSKYPLVKPDTIYDLASLTKVVSTTTLAMQALDRGDLDLEEKLSRFCPEFLDRNKEKITFRHLLSHSAGFPAHHPLYRNTCGKREYLKKILQMPLEYEPGKQSRYSDLGFILLGIILEKINGQSLDHLARENIFSPLGMNQTSFRPNPSLQSRIAPTENDPWRRRVLRGEVHDENAFALGGVAAHAGLFGTAEDLAIFCQAFLNGGVYDHWRIVKRNTVEQFTRRQLHLSDSSRALGWDTPTRGSSAGNKLSRRSFGHTGFTGTSLWIDPRRNLFIVFLTNRVHPSRENNAIQLARRQVANTIVEAIDGQERLTISGS